MSATDPADQSRYLSSLNSFSNLVLNNYVDPSGGITDGIWAGHSGPYWCATSTFGAMSYLLYDQTGDPRQLQAASNATNWMLSYNLADLSPSVRAWPCTRASSGRGLGSPRQ